jgi:hypothetical protein
MNKSNNMRLLQKLAVFGRIEIFVMKEWIQNPSQQNADCKSALAATYLLAYLEEQGVNLLICAFKSKNIPLKCHFRPLVFIRLKEC